MKILLLSLWLLISLMVQSQPQNIMIGNNGNPNEPTIYINAKNPAMLMAGANIDKYYLSTDTGKTWSSGNLQSASGVWGDPVIISDTAGDFYFLHLSNPNNPGHWIDRIVCQKYNTQLSSWTLDTFMGLNGGPDFAQDKEWIAVDPQNNILYVTWTQFDSYGVNDTSKKSNIYFSKSTNAGQTWSQAIRINELSGDCIDSDNTTEGAVPAVGPNGEVYVAWAGPDGLVFDKSTDGGITWLANDLFVSQIPGGWDYDIPGISRCNGLPVTDCDLSWGAYHGNIYINWTDQRNGANNTDVWLVKSADGGNTWSSPIKVNNDSSQHHQFLTWMDIDQSTGYLYFVFYDRRNYSDEQTDVFLAISKDGGQSFENYCISESPFIPSDQVFFGDYNNISVQNGIVRPIWTRFDLINYLSIWTAIINPNTSLNVAGKSIKSVETQASIYPNPAINKVFFSFKLTKPAIVKLDLYDIKGQYIRTLIENISYPEGKHIEAFEMQSLHLSAGVYQFHFESESQKIVKQFVVK